MRVFPFLPVQGHIPALSDLYCHGAGHHISGGQVFGIGCIALHKTLSLAVDQDASLTAAALCDQTTSSVDPWTESHIRGLTFKMSMNGWLLTVGYWLCFSFLCHSKSKLKHEKDKISVITLSPVGWNCTNSRSWQGRPALVTIAFPSPVLVWADVQLK